MVASASSMQWLQIYRAVRVYSGGERWCQVLNQPSGIPLVQFAREINLASKRLIGYQGIEKTDLVGFHVGNGDSKPHGKPALLIVYRRQFSCRAQPRKQILKLVSLYLVVVGKTVKAAAPCILVRKLSQCHQIIVEFFRAHITILRNARIFQNAEFFLLGRGP